MHTCNTASASKVAAVSCQQQHSSHRRSEDGVPWPVPVSWAGGAWSCAHSLKPRSCTIVFLLAFAAAVVFVDE